MIASAFAALPQIFTPPFRSVLWKTLGLTLAMLAVVWLGLDRLVESWIAVPYPWLATTLSILTGLGLVVGLAFLVAPVSSLVAGFFLDDLAELAERQADPHGPLAARFAAVSLLVNALALMLLLVPGVNVVAFIGANAYLLGREYFELAALRYRPIGEVRDLRRRHALYLFVAGLPLAFFVATPILNLLTPLFATAYMVRVHKRLTRGLPLPGRAPDVAVSGPH
jgi:CysZ protein